MNTPTANDPVSLQRASEILEEAVRQQHPEWVTADGECPTCHAYGHALVDHFTAIADPSD